MAPALAWTNAIWKAAAGSIEAQLSLGQFSSMWATSRAQNAAPKLEDTMGPMERAQFVLRTISFEALGPTVWKTDLGDKIRLAKVSPVLVAVGLREAVQRKHERDMAAKLGDEFVGRRACVEILKKPNFVCFKSPVAKAQGFVVFPKVDTRGRFFAQSAACGGIWSRDKAKKA